MSTPINCYYQLKNTYITRSLSHKISKVYFKSGGVNWSGIKRKKVEVTHINLSSSSKYNNQSNSTTRSLATV